MSRPKCPRLIQGFPSTTYFKPRAIPLSELEEVALSLDEYEAINLADFKGLYQEDAASKMKISRPTFGRIIESAHKKIADALINGKAIKIEGGAFKMPGKRVFVCSDCEHIWEESFGTGRPQACPNCGKGNFQRIDNLRGPGKGERCGRGAGQCRRMAGKAITGKDDK